MCIEIKTGILGRNASMYLSTVNGTAIATSKLNMYGTRFLTVPLVYWNSKLFTSSANRGAIC